MQDIATSALSDASDSIIAEAVEHDFDAVVQSADGAAGEGPADFSDHGRGALMFLI
jgi:hypothetical protein